MTYQLTSGETILRLTDNAFIPQAPGNRDYAEYQAWLAKGNTPLPAPAPASPGPDYIAFWDALTTSTIYTAIREQSFTSLPMNTLATPSHEHPLRHPLNLRCYLPAARRLKSATKPSSCNAPPPSTAKAAHTTKAR
jgi:hypothetical protein